MPTPDPTACTSTHSPGCSCAVVTSASCAVTNASGAPPIATRSSPSGTGAHCAAGHRDVLGLRAAAGDAEHPGADLDAASPAGRRPRRRPRTRGPGCRAATRAARGSCPASWSRSARLSPAPCTRTTTRSSRGLGIGPLDDLDPPVGDRAARASHGARGYGTTYPPPPWSPRCGSSTRTDRRSSSMRARPTPCSRSPAGLDAATVSACARVPLAGAGDGRARRPARRGPAAPAVGRPHRARRRGADAAPLRDRPRDRVPAHPLARSAASPNGSTSIEGDDPRVRA